MGFYRGPKIVTDGLILLADPANDKSTGGGVNMSDILENYTNSLQNTGEMSINGDPSFLTNTGDGGTSRYTRTAGDINWATTNFSFCTWAKRPNFTDSKQGRIFDLLKAGNGHFRLTLDATPDLNFRPTAGGSTDLVSGGSAEVAKWYNITVTKSGITSGGSADYVLYINGESVATNTSSALVTDANFTYIQTMNSNDDDDGSTITWNGDFGPFLVYDRVLNSDEVLQNYNSLKSRFNL